MPTLLRQIRGSRHLFLVKSSQRHRLRCNNRPEAAAIATAKIFAAEDKELEKKIQDFQSAKRNEIEKADETIKT